MKTLLLLVLLFTVPCSAEDGGIRAKLLGVWELQNATFGGLPGTLRIAFRNDGSFALKIRGNAAIEMKGVWELADLDLHIRATGYMKGVPSNEASTWTWHIKEIGDFNATFTRDDSQETETYVNYEVVHGIPDGLIRVYLTE
jgi:hypothetical protein